MKIQHINHHLYEIFLYLQHPIHIALFRTLDVDLYLRSSIYTRICYYINREHIKYEPRDVFTDAAEEGQLEVCKWLYSIYNISKKDINMCNNDALYCAANRGHLEVCKWLHKTYKLTKEDATKHSNAAFIWAAEKGHLEVCKWLYATFNLTIEDTVSSHNIMVHWCETKGGFGARKWFRIRNLINGNMTIYDIHGFSLLYGNIQTEILKWLSETNRSEMVKRYYD